MEDDKKQVEEELLKMEKQIAEKDKQLLDLEVFIAYFSTITFLILIFIASYVEMQAWLRSILILFGSVVFAIGIGKAIKIEQTAGYYECAKCHYKYVPEYLSVFMAMHVGRTRYMKCPKCNQKSWQKKVIK